MGSFLINAQADLQDKAILEGPVSRHSKTVWANNNHLRFSDL